MPLTTWNLFEGGCCFVGRWKVGWCEVRWIRWLAEWTPPVSLFVGLRTDLVQIFVCHLHESSPGRHSALSGHQFANIGNCSRTSSSWRLPAIWPSSRSLLPPTPPSFQSVRKHTEHLRLYLYKHFHKFGVFCSSFLELQTEHFRSMTALKDASWGWSWQERSELYWTGTEL